MGKVATNEEVLDDNFYCPDCGKLYTEHLVGEIKNPCGRCKTKLRIIAFWPVFIIIGAKAQKISKGGAKQKEVSSDRYSVLLPSFFEKFLDFTLQNV